MDKADANRMATPAPGVTQEDRHSRQAVGNAAPAQPAALARWCSEGTAPESKVFLRGVLGLTGTEISRTSHVAGKGSGFVHAHRRNEEVYIVAEGRGWLYLDGAELPIEAGDVFRIAAAGRRAIRAADDSALVYYCIQADSGSLVQATRDDGYKLDERASWMR